MVNVCTYKFGTDAQSEAVSCPQLFAYSHIHLLKGKKSQHGCWIFLDCLLPGQLFFAIHFCCFDHTES